MSCNEWKEITLEESGLEIEDGDRGKNYPNKSQLLTSGFCPFLNNKNVIGDKLNLDDAEYISKERDELLRKGRAYAGDIVLTTRGSVGNVALIDNIEYKYVRINSGMAIIRSKGIFNNIFLYQLLKSPYMKQQYYSLATGSAQPQLPIKDIKKLKLLLPPIQEQEAISNVILPLDEKIELNNEMNKTLEGMSQALFKRWFVDFEFTNEDGEPYKSSGGEMVESEFGMIPKGWKVYSVTDLVDSISVKHKFNKDKIVFLNTSDILDGEVMTNEYSEVASLPGQAKKSIQKNDILYSEIRPKNKRYAFIDFEGDDYVVSTKLMVLRAKTVITPVLVYNYLTSNETIEYLQSIAESRSGTFPQITFKELEKLHIALQDRETVLKWSKAIETLFNNIQENKRESKSLSELRDSLLPKLMSGEIRVQDIEANL